MSLETAIDWTLARMKALATRSTNSTRKPFQAASLPWQLWLTPLRTCREATEATSLERSNGCASWNIIGELYQQARAYEEMRVW